MTCATRVVIVNYRTAALTVACLGSLAREREAIPGLRVTVVENASGDAKALEAAIRERGWANWVTLLVAPRNGGFAYGNNLAIAAALAGPEPPDHFVLLNPDTEARPGAVRALVAFLEANPGAGIAGSSFELEDGSEWPVAFRFPTALGQFEQAARIGLVSRLLRSRSVSMRMGAEPQAVDWVSGASMAVRRRVLEEVGLLDERYFLYFEELDFCLRARRAGWRTWYVPQSRVMHLCGRATGVDARDRALDRMPAYWFASRTRYFVKNHGVAYARLADLAYGSGLALCALRDCLAQRASSFPPRMLRDFWHASVLFRRSAAVRRSLEDLTHA